MEKAENPKIQARGQGQETAAIQGRKPGVRFRRESRVVRKSRSNKAGTATGSITGADDKPATCQRTGAGLNRPVRPLIGSGEIGCVRAPAPGAPTDHVQLG